jgi:hemerythrin
MKHDAFVEWDDKYSVGIQLIDDQHKELIKLTNKLYKSCLAGEDAARVKFMATVKSTVDYVNYHFGVEERLLQNVSYPEFAEHKREHEAFAKHVLEEVQSFQEGKKFVPNVFVRYLRDWILSHIAVSDRKYAIFILNLRKQRDLHTGAGI